MYDTPSYFPSADPPARDIDPGRGAGPRFDIFEAARGGVSSAARARLSAQPYAGPRVVIELARVEAAYRRLASGLAPTEIFYAVKANPNAEILCRLALLGACFDVASEGEIDRVLGLGVAPERLSFGNTVKPERAIAKAFAQGVRLFAFDSAAELEKLARAAPGAEVFCRLRVEGSAADWPLSRKFGCSAAMAERLLLEARALGLRPVGLSLHVGSQMRAPEGWRAPLAEAAALWRRLRAAGLPLELLNMGGGFPATYGARMPSMEGYAQAVRAIVAELFGGLPARVIAEPGRGLVAEAGLLEAEVLCVARKDDADAARWVTLDIGKFGGLAETMEEAIRYRIVTSHDGGPVGPCILAGPTCDSADVLYERTPVMLPMALAPGDRVLLPSTGAYTTTYSAVWFNGFAPLAEIVIEGAPAGRGVGAVR